MAFSHDSIEVEEALQLIKKGPSWPYARSLHMVLVTPVQRVEHQMPRIPGQEPDVTSPESRTS